VRVLFVCSRNRLRSPTAEQVFSTWPGIEAESAGLSRDAVTPLTNELVEWAEIIFVMEHAHRAKLSRQFRSSLKQQRLICLGIPDRFTLMQPELVELLTAKVGPYLRSRT
jgi:predicted protein tyrosine phosphatase